MSAATIKSGKFLSALLSFLFLCATAVDGAEVKSDYQKGQQQRVQPITHIRPGNPITNFIARCNVLEGCHYRGLTVFPVEVRGYEVLPNILTLDEVLTRDMLLVTEKGAGRVPVLVVENRCEQHVFLMAGEILVGGKQNRILRQDVLLPPHSGPIELPVYCVERGRWVRASDRFKSDGNLASFKVRVGAQTAADQSTIWSTVAETAKALKQRPKTGDLNYVYKQQDVVRQRREYRSRFYRVLPSHVVGVIVARNGRFVGVDLFGEASLFNRLRGKVLDSYVMDVLNRVGHATLVPDRDAARRFLHRVFAARYREEGTPGLGVIGRAVGNGIDAKALVWNRRLVHASIFPSPQPKPLKR